jgi:hypothetical protein
MADSVWRGFRSFVRWSAIGHTHICAQMANGLLTLFSFIAHCLSWHMGHSAHGRLAPGTQVHRVRHQLVCNELDISISIKFWSLNTAVVGVVLFT